MGDEGWIERRKQLGIDSLQGFIRVFNSLLLKSGEGTSLGVPEHITELNLYGFLVEFGKVSAELLQKRSEDPSLSRYRSLIFLGLCEAALQLGFSKTEVIAAQHSFHKNLGKEVSTPALQKYRKAVKWVVGFSDALCDHLSSGNDDRVSECSGSEVVLHGMESLITQSPGAKRFTSKCHPKYVHTERPTQ